MYMYKHVGDMVQKGDILFKVYSNNKYKLKYDVDFFMEQHAVTIDPKRNESSSCLCGADQVTLICSIRNHGSMLNPANRSPGSLSAAIAINSALCWDRHSDSRNMVTAVFG